MSIDSIGSTGTPKNFIDFLAPKEIEEAKQIFTKLQFVNGSTTGEAVAIAADIAGQILATKASEFDQLWTRIENAVNDRKPISTDAKTDVDKLKIAVGLVYQAMAEVDKGDNIREVSAVNTIYTQMRNHIYNRFLDKQEGIDQRTLQRALDTTDSFFDRVAKRFNQRVQAGEIAGPEIENFFNAFS